MTNYQEEGIKTIAKPKKLPHVNLDPPIVSSVVVVYQNRNKNSNRDTKKQRVKTHTLIQ